MLHNLCEGTQSLTIMNIHNRCLVFRSFLAGRSRWMPLINLSHPEMNEFSGMGNVLSPDIIDRAATQKRVRREHCVSLSTP